MTYLSDAALERLKVAAAWPPLPERYSCLRVAGRGGSATVYEARDEELQRPVAIKVLEVPDLAGHAAARIATEARVLARLDHPGIVPIHERGVLADGRAFYVMKFVKGRPLDAAAARLPRLMERLTLFERVLDTVAFAHAHGVVHRDLKPSNILVGEFGEVFVMDWGSAQVQEASHGEAVIVGTPGFMAPEQRGGLSVDARADVYALGVILSMVAGDDVPGALRSVTARAAANAPDQRYASVHALADDVRRFRSGLKPEAHREGVGERVLRIYRRYELPIVLVLAYILMRTVLLLWKGV